MGFHWGVLGSLSRWVGLGASTFTGYWDGRLGAEGAGLWAWAGVGRRLLCLNANNGRDSGALGNGRVGIVLLATNNLAPKVLDHVFGNLHSLLEMLEVELCQ